MSYILDALRKADAERERDPARGIHAQPAPLPVDASSRFPSWVLPAVAGVAVVGVGAAWLMRPAAPSAPAPVPVAVAPRPAAPVPPLREAPSPVAPPVVQVAAAVSPPAPPPLPAPERPAVERPAARPAAATVAKVAPAAPAPAAAPASASARPPAAAPAADRVLTLAELPPDVQAALPKLQISGGVYSENPGQRMLIVGGQVMNEGAELAPGTVLEQIKPHAAVLKFRGYRYSVAY